MTFSCKALYPFIFLFMLASCGGGGTLQRDPDGTPQQPDEPDLIVSMAITDQEGNPNNELSAGNPLQIAATVTDENGNPQVDVLVTFSFSLANLAQFDNDTGTSLTDADGIATIGLIVADESGDGTVVATLDGGETAEIGFKSSGISETETIPASLEFFASTTLLASSGSDQVELIALVKNENNVLLEGVNVDFSANAGASLQIVQGVSAADGTARALLNTRNNPQNRTITAVARTVNFEQSIDIEVTGTTVSLNGPASVVLNDPAPITVVVADSDGNGIANQTVQLTSNIGQLVNPSPITGADGQVTVGYSSMISGTDTIVAEALNASGSIQVIVQQDDFAFSTVPEGDVRLNEDADIEIQWSKDGTPFAGGEVTLTASRGNITPDMAVTDADGIAAFTIRSDKAGLTTVSAIGKDSEDNTVSARLQFEFVATNVASIFVDAESDIIGPEGQTTAIRAVLRDENGNLVKGQTVEFELEDVSGGNISPNLAITDSNGLATTVYTSNAVSSRDGVVITARSSANPVVQGQTFLTVANRAFDVSLGTGNEIESPDSTTYLKRFAVFVSDSSGQPVRDVSLSASVAPISRGDGGGYLKGVWVWDPIGEFWYQTGDASDPARPAPWFCVNEDFDDDGVLDPSEDANGNDMLDPGEDTNNNGLLDRGEDDNGDGLLTPGIVGTLSFENSDNLTNENGQATLEYRYPRQFATWTAVVITIFAQSSGSEGFDNTQFGLEVAAEDLDDENDAPPRSPFGVVQSCDTSN